MWFDYKGLSIKSNGSAALSGNLDVGQDQAQTSIKAYVDHVGYTGNVEIFAKYAGEGFINLNTTNAHGWL